jgi:aminoglycoside 6'-N-acetyltransferase
VAVVIELKGERVVLRPLTKADVPALAAIQAQPSVARWWGQPNESDLSKQAAGESEETSFAITVDGALAGLIQYVEETEPMYRHAGIDLFLAEERQGRGLGTDAVRTLARHLVEDRGHHRLTIDPAVDNHAAIRAYEKVGFRPVGVMRRYERTPDGNWRDGLLMDLLADEL